MWEEKKGKPKDKLKGRLEAKLEDKSGSKSRDKLGDISGGELEVSLRMNLGVSQEVILDIN